MKIITDKHNMCLSHSWAQFRDELKINSIMKLHLISAIACKVRDLTPLVD